MDVFNLYKILKVASENELKDPRQIAEKFGLIYNGLQEGIGKILPHHIFTVSGGIGTTFGVILDENFGEEAVRKELENVYKRFNK